MRYTNSIVVLVLVLLSLYEIEGNSNSLQANFKDLRDLKSSKSSSSTSSTSSGKVNSGSTKSVNGKKAVIPDLDDYDEEDYDDYMDEIEYDLKKKNGKKTTISRTHGHPDLNNNNKGHGQVKGQVTSSGIVRALCPVQLNRCSCGYAEDNYFKSRADRNKPHSRVFLVNCTNSGYTDPSVLSYLPDETGELIFTGNQLSELPANVFGGGQGKEFEHLKLLDLSNNGITHIRGKAFHHVAAVERLILNHNNISEQSIQTHPRVFSNFLNLRELHLTDAFQDIWDHTISNDKRMLSDLTEIFIESNLTKLIKLHLEQNELELITNSTIFCELPALLDLYLGQNHLTDINVDISCLPRIRYIDGSYNRIQTISETSGVYGILRGRSKAGHSVEVKLNGNPLLCDCQMDEFLNWLRKWSVVDPDKIRRLERLTCDSGLPPSNKGQLLLAVNHTDCAPLRWTAPISENSGAVGAGLGWFLGVLGALLLALGLFTKRATILRSVQPLLNPCEPHGVKYTSIDKEPEPEPAHV